MMDFGLAEFGKRLPDAELVLAHAADIMAIGERADELMDSIGHTWMALTQPGVYSVPGNEVVFTALDPARTAATDLANDTIQLDAVMRTYAESLAWLKIRYEDLKARVAAFQAEYPEAEKDEWDNDGSVVGTRNALAEDVGRLFQDLDEDQREAANRIANITGSGRSYDWERALMDSGAIVYGHDRFDYRDAYSGGYLSKDLPWYRDTLNFVGDTATGIQDAGWETLAGVGVLIGFRGANERSAAWKNMYRVGENLFILGPGKSLASDERTVLAVAELGILGTQIIRMDQWNSDRPGLALGGNIFDAGTLLLGGVVAGGAKAGLKALTPGGPPGTGRWPGIRTGVDEFGGLVPAIPGGQLPMFPDAPSLPNNDTMFRGGKPRIDFSPEYSPSGRDPADQPQPGDTDSGNGYFTDEWRSRSGAPEQQYITGIDHLEDSRALEYALEKPDGDVVMFDGHSWRDGVEVFTEVKGHYEFFNKWAPHLLDAKVHEMLDQVASQKEALANSATPGYVYEWVFTEKIVADKFKELLNADPDLATGVKVRFEPMPSDSGPTPPQQIG